MTYDVVIFPVRRASLSSESADIFPCSTPSNADLCDGCERKHCDEVGKRGERGVVFVFGGSWLVASFPCVQKSNVAIALRHKVIASLVTSPLDDLFLHTIASHFSFS
jgi:hypothetical protein